MGTSFKKYEVSYMYVLGSKGKYGTRKVQKAFAIFGRMARRIL